MKRLQREIVSFFHDQGYAIVSTLDRSGCVHSSCKGVVELTPAGRVYLFDLYKGRTYRNLQNNKCLSITGVDDHSFTGYCLKGTAKVLTKEEVPANIMRLWEEMVTRRLTRRILRNVRQEHHGRTLHPEALLPAPRYLIVLDVREIVDLRPHHMRGGSHG